MKCAHKIFTLVSIIFLGICMPALGMKYAPPFSKNNRELLAECNNTKPDLAKITKLLEHKAYPNIKDEYGRTSLQLAASSNVPAVVALLISKDALVNTMDNKKKTPLLDAISNDDPETVKILLENRADVNQASNCGQTPLYTCVHYAPCLSVVKTLLEYNADPNIANCKAANGVTPLTTAAAEDLPEIAQALIIAGANPRTVQEATYTQKFRDELAAQVKELLDPHVPISPIQGIILSYMYHPVDMRSMTRESNYEVYREL